MVSWFCLYHDPMTTIQIRTDEKIKKKAQGVFHKLGIDMSSTINVFLYQVILRDGLPFKIVTENGLTPHEEEEILQAEREAEAGINVTKGMSAKQAIEYLHSL